MLGAHILQSEAGWCVDEPNACTGTLRLTDIGVGGVGWCIQVCSMHTRHAHLLRSMCITMIWQNKFHKECC